MCLFLCFNLFNNEVIMCVLEVLIGWFSVIVLL